MKILLIIALSCIAVVALAGSKDWQKEMQKYSSWYKPKVKADLERNLATIDSEQAQKPKIESPRAKLNDKEEPKLK